MSSYVYSYHLAGGLLLVVLAAAATGLLLTLVLPKERDGDLPWFFQRLHDLFNPKTLVIEKILKLFYVFFTCLSVLTGVVFVFEGLFHLPLLAAGLFLAVVAPLLLRGLYELLLLLVLQVKTTREIDAKLARLLREAPPQPAPPPQPPEPAVPHTPPAMTHCPACGTWYRTDLPACPICSHLAAQGEP